MPFRSKLKFNQKVGEVFFNFGVNCLVVIQSEHKINDEYAKQFSNFFYENLLDGKTIVEAFEFAKTRLKADKINAPESCCCGHAHKEGCGWYEFAKREGIHVVRLDLAGSL